MKVIRVLICDDSAFIRRLLTHLLADVPDIRVVGTAEDPYDAREKIKKLNPDVLTLDVEMPNMDGISFLEKIMALRPMPVIMISTLTQSGAETTLQALEIGAFDYLGKPQNIQKAEIQSEIKEQLIEKIRAAAVSPVARPRGQALPSALAFRPARRLPLIAIGASTGGVEALRELLAVLPANAPPIVMAQHMPGAFTRPFAARLHALSPMTVHEAKDGEKIHSGHAYLAPGGQHLTIDKAGGHLVCRLDDGPKVSGHRPSVDRLFFSVAKSGGAHAVGVLLTGMGKDGAAGLKAMRDAGAHTIAQDEASCVVHGMPKAAVLLSGADIELPLSRIARHVLTYCEEEAAA